MIKLQPHIFVRVFFWTLIIAFSIVLISTFHAIPTYWAKHSIIENVILLIGVLIFIWGIIYFYLFITGTRIVLNNNQLMVRTWKKHFSNIDATAGKILSDLKLPFSKEIIFGVKEIDSVFIGNLHAIKKYCKESGDILSFKEITTFNRNLIKNTNNFAIAQQQTRTYIYFKLISNNQAVIADVNSCSRRQAVMFINEIKKLNSDIKILWKG